MTGKMTNGGGAALWRPPQTPEEAAEQQARDDAAVEVLAECARSRAAWPAYHSGHECYGVLAEEVVEFFEAVRLKESNGERRARMRAELAQIAAVAIRGMVEL